MPGQRYLNKEVYILTSHRTGSAAEEFTYDMKEEKRATVVGEVTGGGANPCDDLSIGKHFTVLIPIGYSVNPITHTNWESVGIKPDIEVAAADALTVAEKNWFEHFAAVRGAAQGSPSGPGTNAASHSPFRRSFKDLHRQISRISPTGALRNSRKYPRYFRQSRRLGAYHGRG